ncbi:MAG: thiamine phosphate synthase [Zetaproteobacteria bacterium CG_4_9_14_3_um_filter_53_7]|nr:MAG: thiamine phosphate synthase [Zetaproteobacteria bacterium CG_4_9_14_3_um_filter_53_7]
MPVKPPVLTLITDSSRFSGEPFFGAVTAALQGGVDAVLVREKNMDSARLLAFASRLRQITRQFQAKLMIHTQADIALAVDADGVHLGSSDISEVAATRAWLNDAGKTVSVSCHNLAELKAAEAVGADYIFLSPLFPTLSHPGAAHLGIEAFQQLAGSTALPVVALGGINCANRKLVPVSSCATISTILGADDPQQNARLLAGCGR